MTRKAPTEAQIQAGMPGQVRGLLPPLATYAARLLARDYPEHRCPPGDTPDWERRSTLHTDAGTAVLGCYLDPACGCRIVGDGTLQHPIMVEPCSVHGPVMYPALAPKEADR